MVKYEKEIKKEIERAEHTFGKYSRVAMRVRRIADSFTPSKKTLEMIKKDIDILL